MACEANTGPASASTVVLALQSLRKFLFVIILSVDVAWNCPILLILYQCFVDDCTLHCWDALHTVEAQALVISQGAQRPLSLCGLTAEACPVRAERCTDVAHATAQLQ